MIFKIGSFGLLGGLDSPSCLQACLSGTRAMRCLSVTSPGAGFSWAWGCPAVPEPTSQEASYHTPTGSWEHAQRRAGQTALTPGGRFHVVVNLQRRVRGSGPACPREVDSDPSDSSASLGRGEGPGGRIRRVSLMEMLVSWDSVHLRMRLQRSLFLAVRTERSGKV